MNPMWHVFDLASGQLLGRSIGCAPSDLALNLREGEGAVAGVTDWQSQRVELIADDFGSLVPVLRDWQPPAPPDDELRTWRWDPAARRWVAAPTLAARSADVRTERDRRLQACDWVVARAVELGEPVPASWAAYRQALRAVPEQPGFPDTVIWPQPPH